jgi:hypothetical protein
VWSARGDATESEVVEVGSYLATVLAAGLPSALGVLALFSLLGALRIAEGPRAGVCLAYALGTPVLPYATLFYGHALAAALSLLGFALLVQHRDDAEGPGLATASGAGLALGGAVVAEYPAVLMALAVTVYAATRPWRARRRVLLGLVAGGALPALLLAAYHAAAFGGVFTTGYAFSTQPHRSSGLFMGMGWPRPGALVGLTVSPFRGLFFTAPWLLFAFPGWWAWWGRARAETAVCLVAGAGFAAMNLLLLDWEGGWATGPRYLVPSLPFWAIGAAGIFAGWAQLTSRRRVLCATIFGACALLSVALLLVATAVGPEVSERIANPFAAHLLPRFGAGDLALSTQSFEMAQPAPDGARQAWNLGQRLGLDGLTSLVPLFAAWGICAAWLWNALRRRAV